jgi:single-strand DNA-binding protein
MSGMNKVYLLGNLGADPELKLLPSGTAVLKLRLATTETYLDKDKNKQDRTEWHHVTIFGARGEALAKHLSKGQKVLIEGRIHHSSSEKDGQKRYYTEIIATDLWFAGGGYQRPGASLETLLANAPPPPPVDEPIEELPF